MRLHQLEIFCRVAERQSVTRAAEDLRLTQPAVSLQIRELEKQAGVKLFQRLGHQFRLTPAGDLLYRYAAAMVEMRQSAERALAEFRQGSHGRVIVGASTTGVLYYLPPMIRDYRRAFPNVDIVLRADITDRVREEVARQTMDVGLVWGPVTDERLTAELLATDEFAVVLPTGHPLAHQDEVTPQQLSSLPFILPLPGTSTRKFIEGRLREAGVIPDVHNELANTEAMKRAVECHLGVAVLSKQGTRLEVEAGGLRALQLKGVSLFREIMMIHRQDRHTSAVSQGFMDFIRAHPLLAQLRASRPPAPSP